MKASLLVILGLMMVGTETEAVEPSKTLGFGLHAGVLVPTSSDLRVTTGSGLNAALGALGEWPFRANQTLRARLEVASFAAGEQLSDGPTLRHEIRTTVKNASLGAEYLFQPQMLGGRWSVGAGLYLIRWSVASSSALSTAGGSFLPSGTSTWTREGLGVLGGYRWTDHAGVEFRLVSSHYGYENQPASFASLNFLWHF